MEAIDIHRGETEHSGRVALRYLVFMILLLSLAVWASWVARQPRNPYANYRNGLVSQEKIAFGDFILGTTPSVHVQNVGSSEAIITDYIIKDSTADTVATGSVSAADGTLAGKGDEADIPFSLAGTSTGQSYSVTLVTQAGGAFVSATFYAP